MSTTATAKEARALRPAEIDQFHTLGYLGPFTAVEPDDMAGIRQHVERTVLKAVRPARPMQSRHLDSRKLYDLITRPAIIDRVSELIGPDVVLWQSNIFNKQAGEQNEIPWHQDYKFWPIEPPLNISAWIAIDEVTAENSCVQLIPGSHLDVVPHVPAHDGQQFSLQADPEAVDTTRAINMELRPGQFFLFVERLLHHSEPNRSSKRRMGIAARYSVPFVKINHEQIFPGHRAILVRGRDVHEFNRYATPPAE